MKLQKQFKHFLAALTLLICCGEITYAQSSNLSDTPQKSETKKMKAKMSVVAPETKAAIKNEVDDQPTTPYNEMTPEEKLALLEEQYAEGKVSQANYDAAKARLLELIDEQD